jgi:DNA-binding MarR family transcriptional regulator
MNARLKIMSDHAAPTPAATHRSGAGRGTGSEVEAARLPDELRTWMRMLAAAGAIEQTVSKHVKRTFGISHDEFLVLCLLADQPGGTARMTQVAELLGRPKTRLTYQVRCLQHFGFVTRETARGDRRGITLTLTDKARRLLAEQGPDLASTVREALTETIACERGSALTVLLPAHALEETSHDGTPDSVPER